MCLRGSTPFTIVCIADYNITQFTMHEYGIRVTRARHTGKCFAYRDRCSRTFQEGVLRSAPTFVRQIELENHCFTAVVALLMSAQSKVQH